MDCPVCKEGMVVLELNEVEVDYCLACKGIWLDEGELELLLEGSREKTEKFLAAFELDRDTEEKGRKCPICRKRMVKVLCGEEKKIRIDKCKKEHGIWFDEGELEEVIKAGSGPEGQKVLELLKDMFGK